MSHDTCLHTHKRIVHVFEHHSTRVSSDRLKKLMTATELRMHNLRENVSSHRSLYQETSSCKETTQCTVWLKSPNRPETEIAALLT